MSVEEARPGALTWAQRRFYVQLGTPALGMALVVTVVSTYLPVLVEQASGPVLVGVLIGAEGFFGIFVPAIIGAWSDRTSTRVGDRVPYLLACAVVVVLAMTAVGVVAALGGRSFAVYVGVLVALYAGYYGFLSPHWSLYPDLVPDEHSGRSRSAEGTMRVIGTGLALVGGGLLLDVWVPLPFLAGAAVCSVTVAVCLVALRGRRDVPVERDESGRGSVQANLELLRDRGIRTMCLNEGLWNFALSALRAFVVLYFTVGLGRSTSFVSAVIFPLVAVGIALAAPTAGWVADRFGYVRILTLSSAVYAVGMALPAFSESLWVAVAIPLVAAGAATVMTIPFAVLMRMLPASGHGAASGLFGFSRGLGSTLGPIVCGVVIVLTDGNVFASTDGYAAMWLVCSVALLATAPLMWSLRRDPRV
jgi:Na+/melibiose symporter-like transporter